MQAFLLGSPSSVDGGGGFSVGSKGSLSLVSWVSHHRRNWPSGRRTSSIVATAAINGEQDHYAVLGLSSSASCADIKRAYRLLARKYHPDVSKDSKAGEVFKSIRLAYDVLSDEAARVQYDHKLKFQDDNGRPWRGNWTGEPDFDDGIRIYRWAKLRRRMQEEKYWKEYETDEMEEEEEETTNVEREPFSEVLKSAFFTLFFTQTLGYRLSLTLCSLSALFDKKLDAGYKMGYIIAWILGGRGGILLTLCLSFGSWLCGKTSSSLVALVVMAMWVGANLARYVPLPQGALLTLLYMSVKLQVDLS